jgi:hypothetical protein
MWNAVGEWLRPLALAKENGLVTTLKASLSAG